MKLVVDANILFSLAKPSSVANKITTDLSLELFAPDFAIEELTKYKEVFSKKSGLEFKSAIKFLKERVVFVNKKEYSGLINKFLSKISDEKDLVYLALAFKLNLPVWSNDKHLKEQSEIPILSTSELISLVRSEE